jgi:hypothetical protein
MEVLKFIFVLGINFSIFGFIWGLMMIALSAFRPQAQQAQAEVYILRIIKYFLLVSVTANYVLTYQQGSGNEIGHIVIGTIVLALYLLGKLQNRTMISQLAKSAMFGRFYTPPLDIKVERFLLLGSVIYFVACLLLPWMVDNSLIIWFTDSIVSIYEAAVIGWIFKIIAFFFLINIIFRAANVIGSLLNGQSLTSGPNMGGTFTFNQGSNPFEQFREKQEKDSEWTDYEDVTDEDEDEDSRDG